MSQQTLYDFDLSGLGESAFNTIRRRAIKNARRGMGQVAAQAASAPAASTQPQGGLLTWLRGMPMGKKVLVALTAGVAVSWALDANANAKAGA